jgi:hypothetical protein
MILDDGVTSITLPDDLEWTDEYDWDTIRQDVQPMIGGGMIVSESVVTAGRPFTLVSGENVWVTKTTLDQIYVLANALDKQLTLTLPDARTFTVMFRRDSEKAYEAKPVWRKTIQSSSDNYTLTLRLMEV